MTPSTLCARFTPVVASIALCAVASGPVQARTAVAQAAAAQARGLNPSATQARDEAELIKLERDYAKALIAKDIEFMKRFYAPDWRGGNWMGFGTRLNIMNLLRDQRYVVTSMKLTEIKVRIVGAVGIVQGVDTEISSMHGRDTSGSWGFTDIFEKRNGRWVAIASQTTKVNRGAPAR